MAKKNSTENSIDLLFPPHFWQRPPIKERQLGEPFERRIFQAVGAALTEWGRVEESFAVLYSVLCGVMPFNEVGQSVSRGFGSIENTGWKITAARAVAPLYFGEYWRIVDVSSSFVSLMENITWASHRRNDIAHGRAVRVRQYVKDGLDANLDSGYMLVAPRDTSRTNPFPSDDKDDIFGITASQYRFSAMDIYSYSEKFLKLANYILSHAYSTMRNQETGIPGFILKMKQADPEGFERKMRR